MFNHSNTTNLALISWIFFNTSLTVFTVSKLILSTPANGGLKFIFSTFFLCSFIHLMTTFLIFRVTLWKPLRLKALEDLNRTSVDVLLRKTNASALNSGSDFDKYVAMQLAEEPVTCASNAHYKKFPYHSVALQEIRQCLHKPKDQFKAYFLALFSNHDYEQVLESLAKVDKSFLEPRSTMRGSATLTCFGCGQIGHNMNHCWFQPYARRGAASPRSGLRLLFR